MRRGSLLAWAVVALLFVFVGTAFGFPDVPASHPYKAAINDLSWRGIIGGFPDGSYGPERPVTRQQFAKMIVLTMDLPVSESDICPFGDVEVGWYRSDWATPAWVSRSPPMPMSSPGSSRKRQRA